MSSFLFALVAVVGLANQPTVTVAVDQLVEGITCAADPSQTYTLYLPPGYTRDKQWPVLLIFDPRGRSVLAAELFREPAHDHGWVLVSSNDTRSDGPWEPNVKAVNALWPEVHGRIAGDPARVYASGFSGGATVAHVLARDSGQIAGVIACGGPLKTEFVEGSQTPVFATAGNTDFNFQALQGLDAFLSAQHTPHRTVVFDGAHQWMPSSVARQALEWFEILAMKDGLRERDPELLETIFASEVTSAEELAAAGKELAAAQQLDAIARTFDGMHDIARIRARAAELATSPEARRQRKEAKRWKAFESRSAERLAMQIAVLRTADLPPPPEQVARELRFEELKRRAERGDAEGEAAQRVLNHYSSQLGFYLTRQFLQNKQWDRAAVSLELALAINESSPVAWYNLACCRALLRRQAAAVEALERAVELGFDNAELLSSDPDLDSLRDRADFKALLDTVDTE
jgi:dienelactone hydrolase